MDSLPTMEEIEEECRHSGESRNPGWGGML
jgi:hypothetical protein